MISLAIVLQNDQFQNLKPYNNSSHFSLMDLKAGWSSQFLAGIFLTYKIACWVQRSFHMTYSRTSNYLRHFLLMLHGKNTSSHWNREGVKLRRIIQSTTANSLGHTGKTYPSNTSQKVSITALGMKSQTLWSALDSYVVALNLKACDTININYLLS